MPENDTGSMKDLLDAEGELFALATLLAQAGHRHVCPTPLTIERVNARPENRWARDATGVFGWSRPFREGAIPAKLMQAMRAARVLREDADGGWRSRVRASTLDGALYLHSAYPTTAPDAVFFGPDTYRYAREIRRLLALRTLPVRCAVDIGCGAGPGALTIARACPEAQVWATDINPAALLMTRVNARLAGVGNLRTQTSDLLRELPGPYDLIVANPPYMRDQAGRAYRDGGGALGEGIALTIARTAPQRLAAGGSLLLYTGVAMVEGADAFLEAVRLPLADSGMAWSYEETDPDVFGEELDTPAYARAERIATVVLRVDAPGA